LATHHRTPPPRAHWVLLGTLLLITTALLTLHGLVLGEFHADESTPQGPAEASDLTVRTGQAVIDARKPSPVTLGPRDHMLALTFDDGPDPEWTPRILAVLDRYHVHATFFVTGAHAAQYPDLVREILAHGNEIGNHTATHADLRDVGPAGTGVELHTTDLALAGAADIATSLVRPPYSATPDSMDDLAWQSVRRIGADGRLVVLSDLDSEDWQRPGVDKIIANATPRDGRGAVLLMHDAGGDRSQTVAALDRFVPAMRAAGWQLDTVSHAVGIRDTNAAADPQTRFGGWLLVAAVQLSDWLTAALRLVLLVASALAVLRTIFVLVVTWIHVRRTRDRPLWTPEEPVTVIVPAYNEKAGIEATVRSVLAADHPVWVIVVDDGSTDGTAEVVERLNLRRVVLIRQANAGKPAALNTGLAAARTDLVVMVDGDTVLERGTVRTVVSHFADPRVGAVSGNAKVGNRGGLLGKWQHIEYVIGFNLDRRMYDVLECMPTVPGAIGAFRRDAVLALGGMPTDTLAEDTDLTMALERDGWRVVYEQQALAWTEAPSTLGQLWKQRYRWCYGTLQAVWKHRHAILERGPAGRLGRRGIPYLLLFQVALPVLGPFVDVAALFGIITGDGLSALLYWLAFLAMQLVPAIVAFRLDRERLRPLLALPLQQFVYRQLMYLVVLQSVMTALAGARLPWHKLTRTGLSIPAAGLDGERTPTSR